MIILSTDGNYRQYNWGTSSWCTFTPNFLPSSPVAYEPGIWFLIQSQAALDDTNKGLKADNSGNIVFASIPQTGNFDEYLWTTEKYNNHYRIRNKKYGTYLLAGANPQIPGLGTISTSNTQFWNIATADSGIYGTNAYHIAQTRC